MKKQIHYRAVARSENPGGPVVMGGDNVSPLVEIGLSDLPNTGRVKAPPPQPPCLRQPCMQKLSNGLLPFCKSESKWSSSRSEMQKYKSPLEKIHMFSTLLLYYREYLLKAGHFMNLDNYG